MSTPPSFRSKVIRSLDDALSPHYVRQEHVARALDELTRLLADRFDAEAEAVAVVGQRLAAMSQLLADMQADLVELRSRQ